MWCYRDRPFNNCSHDLLWDHFNVSHQCFLFNLICVFFKDREKQSSKLEHTNMHSFAYERTIAELHKLRLHKNTRSLAQINLYKDVNPHDTQAHRQTRGLECKWNYKAVTDHLRGGGSYLIITSLSTHTFNVLTDSCWIIRISHFKWKPSSSNPISRERDERYMWVLVWW